MSARTLHREINRDSPLVNWCGAIVKSCGSAGDGHAALAVFVLDPVTWLGSRHGRGGELPAITELARWSVAFGSLRTLKGATRAGINLIGATSRFRRGRGASWPAASGMSPVGTRWR